MQHEFALGQRVVLEGQVSEIRGRTMEARPVYDVRKPTGEIETGVQAHRIKPAEQ